MHISDGAIGRISEMIFDQWCNFEVFETDVERFCSTLSARAGLRATFDSAALLLVHKDWLAECERWKNSNKMPSGTEKLSHFKTLAILLHFMCENGFVNFSSYQTPDPWLEVYGMLANVSELVRTKFVDGQHSYAAWLLVHNVTAWFEENRVLKKTPFVARITDDFETDMVSMLISGLHSSDSIYLILKALFLRD